MMQVNVHEAKTHLSRLLEDVGKGDVVIIAKAGKPMAKLVPYDGEDVTPRRIGFMPDLSEIPEDFDDMMADEIAEMFSSDRP
ncbi:type II toxin-antitoxin system prevent-host-death family antitoxin [Lautropia mirabilis]|jgi:prevent-host-death family protein